MSFGAGKRIFELDSFILLTEFSKRSIIVIRYYYYRLLQFQNSVFRFRWSSFVSTKMNTAVKLTVMKRVIDRNIVDHRTFDFFIHSRIVCKATSKINIVLRDTFSIELLAYINAENFITQHVKYMQILGLVWTIFRLKLTALITKKYFHFYILTYINTKHFKASKIILLLNSFGKSTSA